MAFSAIFNAWAEVVAGTAKVCCKRYSPMVLSGPSGTDRPGLTTWRIPGVKRATVLICSENEVAAGKMFE